MRPEQCPDQPAASLVLPHPVPWSRLAAAGSPAPAARPASCGPGIGLWNRSAQRPPAPRRRACRSQHPHPGPITRFPGRCSQPDPAPVHRPRSGPRRMLWPVFVRLQRGTGQHGPPPVAVEASPKTRGRLPNDCEGVEPRPPRRTPAQAHRHLHPVRFGPGRASVRSSQPSPNHPVLALQQQVLAGERVRTCCCKPSRTAPVLQPARSMVAGPQPGVG